MAELNYTVTIMIIVCISSAGNDDASDRKTTTLLEH